MTNTKLSQKELDLLTEDERKLYDLEYHPDYPTVTARNIIYCLKTIAELRGDADVAGDRFTWIGNQLSAERKKNKSLEKENDLLVEEVRRLEGGVARIGLKAVDAIGKKLGLSND